jgi:hypothetical protein
MLEMTNKVIDELSVELFKPSEMEVSLINSKGELVLDELEVNAEINKEGEGPVEVQEADVVDLESILHDLSTGKDNEEDEEEDENDGKEERLPGAEHHVFEEEATEETDWVNDNDHKQFSVYVVKMMNGVPQHSGNTETGCERAIGYLNAIDKEISRAIRTDSDGVLDEQEIEELRDKVRGFVESLEGRKEQLSSQNKKRRSKRGSHKSEDFSGSDCPMCEAPLYDGQCIANNCQDEQSIVKEAGGTAKITLTMDPWQRYITGILINAEVSGGKNIEEVYAALKEEWNFDKRDEASIQQILADMNYPLFKDRALLGKEDQDPTKSNRGTEFATNYFA